MKSSGIILIAGIGLLIGCSSGGGFDPTLFNEGFKGITYTNEEGRIIGPVDPSDWQLSNLNINIYIPNRNSGLKMAQDILPRKFDVGAAYPNPTKEQVTIIIAVPVACQHSIEIIDESYRVVRAFSRFTEAGIRRTVWDLKDEQGFRLPGGMYRVLYRIGGDPLEPNRCLYGYGDILVQ